MVASRRVLLLALVLALLLSAAAFAAAAPAARALGTISGQLVSDATGAIVPGAEPQVFVLRWDAKQRMWTDYTNTLADGDTGRFILRGLAAGSWVLGVSDRRHGDWALQYWNGKTTREAADRISIVGSGVREVTVRLQPASHITGSVRSLSGVPLADVGVGASIWTGTRYTDATGTTTVADGTYDLKGLAAGTYTLEFLDQNGEYVMQYYDGIVDWRLATPIVVATGATVTGIDAVLMPPPAPGFVGLKSYTQTLTQVAGKSLPCARVKLTVDGRVRTRTASDLGAWKVDGLRLGQGSHEIAATASNLAGAGSARTATVVVDRGKPVVRTPRAASCRRGTIAVVPFRVRDALSPKVRVTVRIATLSGRTLRTYGPRRVPTGAGDLAFPCTLAKGTYRFSVYARDLAGNRQVKVASNLLRVR